MSEDVDIQAEKKKYLEFRKRTILQIIISFVVAFVWLFLWLFFTGISPKKESVLDAMIADFWWLFSPPGLGLLVIAGFVIWLLFRWDKYHFRCPKPNCDEAIYLSDDWLCHVDKSVTKFPWTLWYTIFTGCRKHKHPSPAHRCPNPECKYVFKLVENPRTGVSKFSYRPEVTPQTPPQNPPQLPASQQEYIPRDDGRFF